jgi:hypothetical protein
MHEPKGCNDRAELDPLPSGESSGGIGQQAARQRADEVFVRGLGSNGYFCVNDDGQHIVSRHNLPTIEMHLETAIQTVRPFLEPNEQLVSAAGAALFQFKVD